MSNSEHSLQFFESDSLLHRIYPLVKLIWVFVIALGLFLYHTPIPGLVMFGVVILMALTAGRVPLSRLLGSSRVIFGLAFLLMLFHFFANPGVAIYRLGPLTLTDEGLRQGPVFFFRLSVVVLSSFILIWTTDSRDLMVSLTKAGVPYRYAFAVFLAMRYLPLVQREVDTVRSAHSIRGRAARSGLAHRFKLWQRYMFTVLVNGLRKAEATAIVLDCRAFGCYPTRTYIKDFSFRPADVTLVVVFALLTAVLVYLERSGAW